MFENPETAEYVIRIFLDINGQMYESIMTIQSKINADELQAFKRTVGHVMYEVFDKIVEPIRKRHPSLRPPEMEA